MHPPLLLALLSALALGALEAQAQTCSTRAPGYTYIPGTSSYPAQCCPTITRATRAVCEAGVRSTSTGGDGYINRCTFNNLQGSEGSVLLTAGQMDVSFLATMEGAKGADSRVGGIGGLGSRVTQRFGVPSSSTNRIIYGFIRAKMPTPSTGTQSSGGYLTYIKVWTDKVRYNLVAAGGGGAGYGTDSNSNGHGGDNDWTGSLTPTCGTIVTQPPAWPSSGNYTYTGGGGNGCLPMGSPGAAGTNDGGIGGPSGWSAQLQGGATSAPALNPTLSPATGADGSLVIDFDCISYDPVESTTTIFETVPSSTQTFNETRTVDTVYTTPPTVFSTATVSAESVQPLQSATETYVPPTSSFVEYADVTPTPPVSYEYSTITPDVSSFKETTTQIISPRTQTISSTFTLPTSSFTETVSQTETPATSTISSTVYLATKTLTETVDVATTPLISTKTAVLTSSTGVSNCVSFRMVYPAACCPNTYLSMTKATRARRSIALDKRALTTAHVTNGVTSTTVTVDATATSEAATPSSTVTETSYYPGPLTTVTSTFTADAPSETSTSTRYHEAQADTSTIVQTLDASSTTSTETVYETLVTPLYTDVSTASASSTTFTETQSFTAATPLKTEVYTAPTPSTTVQSTVYHQASTPVTATTTTAFAQSTSCSVQIPDSPKSCPIPLLAGADRLVQMATINSKKALSGGRLVTIDCGTAGVYYY